MWKNMLPQFKFIVTLTWLLYQRIITLFSPSLCSPWVSSLPFSTTHQLVKHKFIQEFEEVEILPVCLYPQAPADLNSHKQLSWHTACPPNVRF